MVIHKRDQMLSAVNAPWISAKLPMQGTVSYTHLDVYKRQGKIELDTALHEMKERGSEYPGGACGLWGCCGAAVSTGMFMSIITKATPLTGLSLIHIFLMETRDNRDQK